MPRSLNDQIRLISMYEYPAYVNNQQLVIKKCPLLNFFFCAVA